MANLIPHSHISLHHLLLKQILEIISFLLYVFQHASLKDKEKFNTITVPYYTFKN